MSGLKALLGETVVDKEFEDVSVDSFSGDGKVVGLYFSAHWCPPCRGFTPKLKEFYEKIKKDKSKPFEVVFLTSDRSNDDFISYYKEMPWLTIPFGDDRKKNLSKEYNVTGIPTLVLLDGDGKLITTDGRSIVMTDPEAENFPWKS